MKRICMTIFLFLLITIMILIERLPVYATAVEDDVYYTVVFKSDKGNLCGDEFTYEYSCQIKKGSNLSGYIPYSGTYGGHILTCWKRLNENGESEDKEYANDSNIYNPDSICSYVPDSDVIFVANWEEAYDVTFITDKGAIQGTNDSKEYVMRIEKGKSVNSFINVSDVDGYVFTGWYEENGDGKLYTNSSYWNEDSIWSYTPSDNITMVAKWEEAYIITYKNDKSGLLGHEDLHICSTNIEKGKDLSTAYWTSVNVTDASGYVFDGWAIENGDGTVYKTSYNDDDYYIGDYIPTGDTTFVPVWRDAYNITFSSPDGYLNGDKNTTSIVCQVGKGDGISQYPTVSNWEEHAFGGWVIANGDGNVYKTYPLDINDGDKRLTDIVPEGDMTFTVKWNNAFTVNFHSEEGYLQGSDENDYPVFIGDGENIARVIEVSNRPGYKMVGWKLRGGDDYIYPNDWIYGSDDERDEYLMEECIPGYYPKGNVTFDAVWKETHTVTFHSDKGYISDNDNSEEYSTIEVADGYTPYWTPYGNHPDYGLVGWKLVGDESGTVYAAASVSVYGDRYKVSINNYVVTKDVTFEAVWAPAVKVTFLSNGGKIEYDSYYDGEDSSAKILTYEEDREIVQIKGGMSAYCAPEVYMEGKALAGWTIEGDESRTIYYSYGNRPEGSLFIDDYVPQKDTTFVAVWADVWNVTFKTDRGYIYEGEDVEEVHQEVTIQVEKGQSINDRPWFKGDVNDYTCIGLKTVGDDIIYSLDDEEENNIFHYVPKSDVTFEAVWEKDEDSKQDYWKVTYTTTMGNIDSGNTSKEKVYSIEKGKSVGASYPTPFCDGYTFKGWKVSGSDTVYTNSSDSSVGSAIGNYAPKSDVIFEAQWEKLILPTPTPEKWKVTFKTDKGKISSDNSAQEISYEVKKGKAITTAPTPIYEGFTFTGWKISGNDTVYVEPTSGLSGSNIYDYKPGADVIFVAQWEKNPEPDPVVQKQSTITAKSFKKTYGAKAFNIGAKTDSDGKLQYSTGNKKVATVSDSGKVTIKGCGKTNITIKVPETTGYKASSKKITITVLPGKVKLKKVSSPKSSQISIKWNKMQGAASYQCQISDNKKFKNAGKFKTKSTSKKLRSNSRGASSSGSVFYVRVRAVTKIGKKTYYGKWSKTGKVKVR